MSRLTETKNTALDSVVMLYANGIVPYGNAKLRKTALICRIKTQLSFIYALGIDMICRNVDHLISDTSPG